MAFSPPGFKSSRASTIVEDNLSIKTFVTGAANNEGAHILQLTSLAGPDAVVFSSTPYNSSYRLSLVARAIFEYTYILIQSFGRIIDTIDGSAPVKSRVS